MIVFSDYQKLRIVHTIFWGEESCGNHSLTEEGNRATKVGVLKFL